MGKKNNSSVSQETIDTKITSIKAKIAECNRAFSAGDLAAYNKGLGELDALEKECARLTFYSVCDKINQAEEPSIIAAIRTRDYTIAGHTTAKTDDGNPSGIKFAEKVRPIDLLAVCNRLKLDTLWQFEVEQFNRLLTLRVAKELGCNAKELKNITEKYRMHKEAVAIDLGKTITSNTKVCKALQSVLDCILPEVENGKPYVCNNYDVAYLVNCYAKRGKAALSVSMAKHSYLRTLITDVAYRLITNGKYNAEYQVQKQ